MGENMKSVLAAIALTITMASTVAMARPNQQCLSAVENLEHAHSDLASAYSQMAQIIRTGVGSGNISYLQMQIVQGNQRVQQGQQYLNFCRY